MKNPRSFPGEQAPFFIGGPAGQLELIASAPKTPSHAVAVVCHPHPLHEGSMHNKVVHTLCRAFHLQGLHTVRFNFRGVGKSEGQFDNSRGEVEDLLAVLAWVDSVVPDAKIWLAGFSFGAYIAAKGAALHSCQQLYSVAPAVTNQPYVELGALSCPWVVIQGEEDEVIAPTEVYAWFNKQQAKQAFPMSLFKIPKASHFFHGRLIELRDIVQQSCTFSL